MEFAGRHRSQSAERSLGTEDLQYQN